MSRSARLHPDGNIRCPWPGEDPFYVAYHDTEWGVPLHDDRALFEFVILEGAQAGLSWHTVLKKRENYRAAFDGFDAGKIARYGAREVPCDGTGYAIDVDTPDALAEVIARLAAHRKQEK